MTRRWAEVETDQCGAPRTKVGQHKDIMRGLSFLCNLGIRLVMIQVIFDAYIMVSVALVEAGK